MRAVFSSLFMSALIRFPQSAFADSHYSELGKRAYALWDCASLGFIAENNQATTLFELGHARMTELLEARADGKLTQENSKDTPIGLSWWLIDGTSVEFSLGYMWANFSNNAFDETYDKDLQAPFEEIKELQKAKAETEFLTKNCGLLSGQ